MDHEKYRYVDHTADVEFIATGRSLEELFSNCLLALFDTISDTKAVAKSKGKTKTIKVSEKAADLEELLWITLQDAFSLADADGAFGYAVESISIAGEKGKYHLQAAVKTKAKHPAASKLDVKGVSRFDLKIRPSKNGISASVVLDV
jgi:SHS2 domain-containing protein